MDDSSGAGQGAGTADVAGVVWFPTSERAHCLVGSTALIDGGMTLHPRLV